MMRVKPALGQRQILTCESVAEWLDNYSEQLLEKLHRKPAVLEAFENSKKLAGYETAKQAWLRAGQGFFHKHCFKNLASLQEKCSIATLKEFFFSKIRIDPAKALIENHHLITLAAEKGDVEFFKRIIGEMRKATRNNPRNMLEGIVWVHWMPCCLWLATDHAASTYLQRITGNVVQEAAYAKARQRLEKLGLVNYKEHHAKPLIIGCSKEATFMFVKGWTNLVPSLSR